MRKPFFIFAAAVIFAQMFILPNTVQAGVIEFLFPSLRKDAFDPTESLQAPFADKKAQEGNPLAEGQLPENAVALHLPHRVDTAIGEWAVTVVSESLSFTEESYSDDLKKTKAYFSPEGRQQYADFLRSKSILGVLASKKYFIRNFVEDVPLLLNKGAVDGSYRWLFEVPVMLSYMDRSMVNYKDAEPVNQKIVLNVQVGRSADAKNASGVLIERWDGQLKKIKK